MAGMSSRSRRPGLAVALAVVLAFLTSFLPAGTASAGLASTGSASHGNASAVARPAARPLVDRVEFGAFVEGMQDDPSRLRAFESKIGQRARIASYYYGYGDVFPAAPERLFADGGRRKVLVSWDMGPTRFAEWSSGQHDAYLDQIAAAASTYPHTLYVRPWPEMNGDWQTFQPTADGAQPHGGTYREFTQAWRYVVTYLQSRGADNLRWVFNPTADTYAETTRVKAIWPGAAYVDVLGLDGFNWGKDSSWGRWRSFRQIFQRQYRKLTALHPRAPVWICEVSSKEPRVNDGAPTSRAHDKASWVQKMLANRSMPRIKALIWFNADKERDWRVDSSRDALRAVRRGLAR